MDDLKDLQHVNNGWVLASLIVSAAFWIFMIFGDDILALLGRRTKTARLDEENERLTEEVKRLTKEVKRLTKENERLIPKQA